MVSIRVPVAIVSVISWAVAGYLGFSSISLPYDKAIHFTTFCILTVEFYFLFDTKNKSLKTLRYVTFFVCTVFASIVSEFVQNFVNPERVFDFNDIAANVCGSLLGLAICYGIQTYILKQSRTLRYRKLNRPVLDIEQQLENEEDYVNVNLQDISKPTTPE